MLTGVKYHTATGPLDGVREAQSHGNIDHTGVDYGGAGLPDVPVARPPLCWINLASSAVQPV